jgi:hypothetical protein
MGLSVVLLMLCERINLPRSMVDTLVIQHLRASLRNLSRTKR